MHRFIHMRLRIAVATTCIMLVPVVAHAQFRGLIKKATQATAQNKVEEKIAQKTRPAAPGEALTSETFAKVMTGARAGDKVLAERDRIIVARDADQVTLNTLSTNNEPARSAYEQANSAVSQCRDANLDKLEKVLHEQIETKMKGMADNPEAIARMQIVAMKYAQQMHDAQVKNDPVALARLNRDIQNEIVGIDIRARYKADTAATDTKCGKLPTPPAALAREDALRAKIEASNDNIRTFEAQALKAGTQASGLEELRYLQLKERLYTIYLDPTGSHSRYAYTDAEMALVKEHNAEITQIKRAL